nr:retrovirus-related Pol polyprotein from transposon TNT 1-94 [Tanacetum cinerariifolium]
MDEEDSRALKRLSESREDKAAKKQKLDEEVAELKRHLQIVPNNDDDVYTEATDLARNTWRSFGNWLKKDDLVSRETISTFKVYSGSTDQHGLHKGYDRFQTLLSQLEIHGAGVSHEDANQKFLTSLPSSWSQVALIMRSKPGLDTLSFDDQYNNLRVFERDVKGSENKVQSCSKTCAESYARLRKLYAEQRDKLGDASVEITAYTFALKKVEAWLGYGDYRYGSILSYENEVLQSVFMNKECDIENITVNDRYAEGIHTVPPSMTGNYMPSGPDVEIDYSKFTYGPKQTLADESYSKPIEYPSSNSDSSVETTTSMSTPVDNAPKIVCEPKVWTDALIIEEYESDSDDDLVSNVQENIEKPSFAFTNYVKHVTSPRENVKELGTPNHYPKIEKQDRHSHTRKGLGYAFTRKSCFICGSFSHLLRDCDLHEKRMEKQVALTKSKEKGNKAHLADYQEFKGGSVAIGGSNGKITGKGKIKAGMLKGIKREYSNARTLQQNGVAERKNMTLIEAARTMLADSFLPTIFWAEAVNTTCYVLNKVLVTKPQNKTPYELLTGRQPIISYLRPFGCHVTILNTVDQLVKFDGKFDSGILVGYTLNSKAFRVYNLETKRVEENLHVNSLENKPNVASKRHAWMFDLDYLTNSMKYELVSLENQANKSVGPQEANNSAGTQATDDQSANSEEIV